MFVNKNTGVHFTVNSEEEYLDLSINYNRPSFFAIEALFRAIALSKRFGWTIFDPQLEAEINLDEARIEPSLQCWRTGNAVALTQLSREKYCIDPRTAYETWQYNYTLPTKDDELQALGVDVYVPRIWYSEVDGRVITLVFAFNGIASMAIPDVDYIAVSRTGILGKKRFGLLPRDTAFSVLAGFERPLAPLPGIPAFFSSSKSIDQILPKAKVSLGEIIQEEHLIDDPDFLER